MTNRVLSVALLVAVLSGGCYSPTLPLPPPNRDGLVVSEPDASGSVRVAGAPGVMEAGDQAVVVNLSSMYGWIVPVEEDGSFEVTVLAETGDWLSVQRRTGYDTSQAVEVQVP